MKRATISALDFVQCWPAELVPMMVEGKLREAGFDITEAGTPIESPSTLHERIKRPFSYSQDLYGNLTVVQGE